MKSIIDDNNIDWKRIIRSFSNRAIFLILLIVRKEVQTSICTKKVEVKEQISNISFLCLYCDVHFIIMPQNRNPPGSIAWYLLWYVLMRMRMRRQKIPQL